MGLAGLSAALSGLRIAQQQINTISGNIANVSTPGFTRKILPQSSLVVDGVTGGVRAETIIRNVNLNLERDLWTQVSQVGLFDIQQTYLSRLEQFHGPPDRELSVAAEIARLKDAFAALADAPEDNFQLSNAVNQAVDTANKINDLAELLDTMRNDAQTDLTTYVRRANQLLEVIANINQQIEQAISGGNTAAALEDQRDEAIKELADIMEVTFFIRGDGVMVVQTNRGQLLTDEHARQLFFDATPLSANSFYPDSAGALFVGDPDEDPAAIDVSLESPGGRIGGLLTLRDQTLPKNIAQLDELAHKLALRFQEQGLQLFTDAAGNVPLDTPPDPTAGPPPIAVDYVGFAREIRVSQAVLTDNTLIQRGTAATDIAVPTGSNEVVRRILEFSFGDVAYQQAVGTVDVRSNGTGGVDLQTWLGIFSENEVTGFRNLATPNFIDIADIVGQADGQLDDPNDQFQITFEEARTGLGPTTITIDLSDAAANFPIGGPITDALDQIVAEINAQITAAAVPAGLAATASRGPNGQIVLNSRGNITTDASFGAGAMGEAGLNLLGLPQDTFTTEDPYLEFQVGNDPVVRVYIEPGDTEAELIDKLILNPAGDAFNLVGDSTGIPGLAYDEVTFLATGELILRPGDDFNNPEFGGDLRIVSGPYRTDGTGGIGVPAGINVSSALFGTFSLGPLQDVSPVVDVEYGSQVSATDVTLTSFRTRFLGPNASIATNIQGSNRLIDFAQKMINEHAQELVVLNQRRQDEDTLREVLQTQLFDDSGVNLDEELSHLIVVQTAFAAAARVVSAVDEMFAELLNAVR
jgi:flagellar hook-associated protein 1 FlgK